MTPDEAQRRWEATRPNPVATRTEPITQDCDLREDTYVFDGEYWQVRYRRPHSGLQSYGQYTWYRVYPQVTTEYVLVPPKDQSNPSDAIIQILWDAFAAGQRDRRYEVAEIYGRLMNLVGIPDPGDNAETFCTPCCPVCNFGNPMN